MRSGCRCIMRWVTKSSSRQQVATAVISETELWGDDDNVRRRFTLQGNSPLRVETLVGCVAAWRAPVSRFITGSVMHNAQVVEDRQVHPLSRHQGKMLQRLLEGYIALRASDNGICHMGLRGPAGCGTSRLLDEFVHLLFSA